MFCVRSVVGFLLFFASGFTFLSADLFPYDKRDPLDHQKDSRDFK